MVGCLNYREYKYWSVITGGMVSRISVFDEHGAEYYMIVHIATKRSYRQDRETALLAIADAMRLGYDPGEVILNGIE